MRLIGISGAAGSGKSTVSKELEKNGFVVLGFADPMKRFVRELLPWVTDEMLWGSSSKREPVRDILKSIGHRWGRETVGVNTWIWYAIRTIEYIESHDVAYDKKFGILYDVPSWPKARGYCIDDVRYDNEAERILELGGELWKCKRDSELRGDLHPSETGVSSWPDWKFTKLINNNLPIEQLSSQIL